VCDRGGQYKQAANRQRTENGRAARGGRDVQDDDQSSTDVDHRSRRTLTYVRDVAALTTLSTATLQLITDEQVVDRRRLVAVYLHRRVRLRAGLRRLVRLTGHAACAR